MIDMTNMEIFSKRIILNLKNLCVFSFLTLNFSCSHFQFRHTEKGSENLSESTVEIQHRNVQNIQEQYSESLLGQTYNDASLHQNNYYFDWPMEEARLSRGFRLKKQRVGKKTLRPHLGLDLAAPKGTLIYAAQDGTVVFSGRAHGYGKMVIIEGEQSWATVYAHLFKTLVKENSYVKRGQPIAQVGRTGRATGNHLHFEIRYGNEPLDPISYLPRGSSMTLKSVSKQQLMESKPLWSAKSSEEGNNKQ